ncbi:hypothetical protein AB0M94_36190 [Streptomyces xanthochromogenes]
MSTPTPTLPVASPGPGEATGRQALIEQLLPAVVRVSQEDR